LKPLEIGFVGDEKRIRCVNDDEIIHANRRDKSALGVNIAAR